MSLLNSIKFYIYKILTSIIDYGRERDRLVILEKSAVLESSTRIDAEAKINNYSNNKQLISIGKRTIIRGQILIFAHGGKIHIGQDCYVGDGSRIWSSESIIIGDRVLVSHNVNIHDTDSHSLKMEVRSQHFVEMNKNGHPITDNFDIRAKPVVIHDDVWLGFNSTILKGVTIGKGAVIAACSVVTKDVPSHALVAGNPAKILRII